MKKLIVIAAVAIWLPATDFAAAKHSRAPDGGDATGAQACSQPCCRKVGRVVCEMQKVEKPVWVVECEEFCVPTPPCGAARCSSCGQADGCGKGCCDPPPRCGPVRCRKKLVKKTITCEVPVYKCIVVPCGCGHCGGDVGEPVKADQTREVYLPAPLPRK